MTTPGASRKSTAVAPARARLSEQVYQQIHRLILRGEFPRDCKLPTEGELGQRLGVSRPVVREALARLRREEIVRSRQGSGTFVLRGPPAGSMFLPPIRTVADLLHSYDFRIHVEGETAFLAAERHTKEKLADIERCLDEAEAALEAGTMQLALDLNFDFHRAVARATNNPFYVATIGAIPNLIGISRESIGHIDGESELSRARVLHEEHQGIFRAIRDRDGRRARGEMQAHIDNARQFVLERRALA